MTDKPKFVATVQGSNLPATKGFVATAKTNLPNIPKFNLSQLNMVQIAHDLSTMMNKPNPSGWLGKWWGNKKLDLDNDRISHMANYIERVRSLNQSMINAQAELFLSAQVLEDIINGYYIEAERKAEKQLKEHENLIHSLNDEMEKREITNDRARAEIEAIRATTRLTEIQGKVLEKLVNELDLANITPAQAFVFVKSLNPNADANVDFASQQLMLEAQLDQMKATTAKKVHEARREGIQADQDNLAYIQTKKKYD